MAVIRKITIEFDDETLVTEGAEAQKWDRFVKALANFARTHGINPFALDPIKWEKKRT